MTKIHGKDTVVTLDGNDLSTHSNSVEFTRSGDPHDVTTFGNDSHRKQGGLFDGTATISGIYDDTASTGPAAVIEPLINTVVPLTYQAEGAGAGKPEKSVNVLVVTYTQTSPVADMVTWECEVEFDGDVTDSVQV